MNLGGKPPLNKREQMSENHEVNLHMALPPEYREITKCSNPSCNSKRLHFQQIYQELRETKVKLEYRWICNKCEEETRIVPCNEVNLNGMDKR